MLNRVMTKDNIALAALLETKPTVWEQSQLPPETDSQHQQILVCTAHIHWDPEFCDVKLIQVYFYILDPILMQSGLKLLFGSVLIQFISFLIIFRR